ncbi:MAG: EamA family transporter [Chloroflexota bacterium]
MTPFHTFIAVLINLIWGSMFIAGAIGLEEFPPVLFTGIRFSLLLVLLAGFLKVPKPLIFPLAKIGLLMGTGNYLTLYMAIALTDNTGAIAVFSKLDVPFALMLGVVLLNERIGPQRIAGTTLAFFGALLISFDPAAFQNLPALFWMAISSGFSAYTVILVRQLDKQVHPLTITAWVSLIGAPTLLLTSFIFESGQQTIIMEASLTGWGALVYTAIMSSLIAHSAMYFLLQRYTVAQVSPFTLLASVFAVIGGVLILDDQLTVPLVIGSVLILAGVAWINRRKAVATTPETKTSTLFVKTSKERV